MKNDIISIRGINFNDVDLNEAVGICRNFLSQNSGFQNICHIIHTPNAEIVQKCIDDPKYYDLINSAELIIPDGAGVILASKILKTPLKKGKVAGIELAEKLIEEASRNGYGVFFLGGKPGIAELTAEKMKEKYPSLIVSGVNDGFFKKIDTMESAKEYKNSRICGEEEAAVIKKINDSGAQILLVCLGVPKQEIWLNAHKNDLNVKLAGGFGGSFDIYAGVSRRAPKFFITLNLEWLYRLLREPRRIGRMMNLPKFIFGTLFLKKTHKK